MGDPDFANTIAYLVVSVPDTKPRTVRVNVILPDLSLRDKPQTQQLPQSALYNEIVDNEISSPVN